MEKIQSRSVALLGFGSFNFRILLAKNKISYSSLCITHLYIIECLKF
ncbi:hypothetical protein LEP1GSC188_4119 [Leptospira weilii serovar Topaz str. LT2116]|uniref:Uncharacterized protein n=1 Tax=Leptospira weilii serovar Topaz str. LT2116 TaxID=1088540 RepID=M3ES22_9LEPT|nr:hypothetical protein LEP1GSC188_4119 [Leptospira weilii serovar Topaz str. LT2116]